MAQINVSVFNQSKAVSDGDVSNAVAALKVQLARDFNPVWGLDAAVDFYPANQVPAGTWQLGVFDDSDQAGALGYHDVTEDDLPIGKAFAGTDLQYKSSWTVTMSHELLEMLVDPGINLSASAPLDRTLRFYAYEVCDACEDDQYGYMINVNNTDILVSDFVYPAWFEYYRQPNSTQFDFQKKITQPFDLLSNGYISVLDLDAGVGWTNLDGNQAAAKITSRGQVGSRRERRRTNHNLWLRSRQ